MFSGGGTPSLFGSPSAGFGSNVFSQPVVSMPGILETHNPNKDYEVASPPDDSISALAFSPPSLQQNYLIAGSWDNQVRCWEVQVSGTVFQSIPKAQQTHTGPVLDVAWSDV